MTLPQSASVVIIGGGVMGASTAYHLALKGLKDVLLLERESFFGIQATGKCAGGIRYQTGMREIPWFAGLGRRMPVTMAAFTVAALSMIGVPPTAGFFSKWYLILGSVDAGNWIFVAAILLSSLLNAVYFFRVIERVYAKPVAGKPEVVKATDPPLQILVPILVLATGVLVLGLTNAFIVERVINLVVSVLY